MVSDKFPSWMKLDLFLKDLRLMLDDRHRLGIPLPLTCVAQQFYRVGA